MVRVGIRVMLVLGLQFSCRFGIILCRLLYIWTAIIIM